MGNLRIIIGVAILIPVYLIVGILLGSLISNITGIWDYYTCALTLPIIGLVCTWFVVPYKKNWAVVGVYFVGIILAYYIAFPAYYPEHHEMAYMPTYKPFIVTLTVSTLILGGLFVASRYPKKL